MKRVSPSQTSSIRLLVKVRVLPDGALLTLSGRDAWTLLELAAAGAKGCTPIDNPAPRWSAYVFNLRAAGFDIETLREANTGEFDGTHGRYILKSKIEYSIASAETSTSKSEAT
jgi:hypothetical protein